jgi:hypothetical protein
VEIFRDRLGLARESSISLEIDRGDIAAETLEEERHYQPARAPHAVQSDLETALPYCLYVDEWQIQDLRNVPIDRMAVSLDLAYTIPAYAGNLTLY